MPPGFSHVEEMHFWVSVTPRLHFSDCFALIMELPQQRPRRIAPFQRCYLADDSGRVLEVRDGFAPAFVGDLCARTIF